MAPSSSQILPEWLTLAVVSLATAWPMFWVVSRSCGNGATGALSGGKPVEAVWLECKTPSFAFADREVQVGFFKEATEIISDEARGNVPRERIFSNVVHTVDGTWNFDGKAMNNAQLNAEIARG